MDSRRLIMRLKRELERLMSDPTPGISCYARDESPMILDASIIGPKGTPYEGGIFHLEVVIPDEYPFQPPAVRFLTKIFHPNIDEFGRICLDILKAPPHGGWRCINSISTVLDGIQWLLIDPNPSDPLCPDVGNMYYNNREMYLHMAKEFTKLYAQCETPIIMPIFTDFDCAGQDPGSDQAGETQNTETNNSTAENPRTEVLTEVVLNTETNNSTAENPRTEVRTEVVQDMPDILDDE